MTPDFKLLANGANITAQIADRLISLTVTDEAGLTSDQLEITLDDRDGLLEIPAPGAQIVLMLGYRETTLVPMGIYTTDEVTISAPPATMTIRAKAADLGGGIKGQRSRSWTRKTISEMVETIAAEHKLKPQVSKKLANIRYEHIDQTDESDLTFLARIAKDHDALATVKGGALIVMPRGTGQTVSGKPIPPTIIYGHDCTEWTMTLATRDNYKSVTAYWQDRRSAQRKAVSAGEGAPEYRLKHSYPTEAEARAAAQGKLAELARGADELSLTMIGNPLIAAEVPLVLVGCRLGADGPWIATSVAHSLGPEGMTTRITAQRGAHAKA